MTNPANNYCNSAEFSSASSKGSESARDAKEKLGGSGIIPRERFTLHSYHACCAMLAQVIQMREAEESWQNRGSGFGNAMAVDASDLSEIRGGLPAERRQIAIGIVKRFGKVPSSFLSRRSELSDCGK